jgi:hypothetical protein
MRAARPLIGCLLALLALSVGCVSPVEPTGPVTTELGVGTSLTHGPLTVTFVEVTTDSRCPLNALCIHAGDATVVIAARVGGDTSRYTLQINDPARRSVVHAGYVITATELAPYPYTVNPIDPASYRLTVKIDKG